VDEDMAWTCIMTGICTSPYPDNAEILRRNGNSSDNTHRTSWHL